MSKHLKNIGVVSLLTVISRLLGLVRDMLATAIFGTTALMSAFYAAYTLPNLFRRLLAEGSLTAAFIPTLQDELHANGRPGIFRFLSQIGSWLLVICSALTAGAMVLFSHSRLLPGHDPIWYITADLTVIVFPYLTLISLSAACNATLNVLEHFTEPALSPIWLNLAMIASLAGAGLHYAHSPMEEMHWLCAGVLVGGFFQLAVPAGTLIWLGWRPRFAPAFSPRVREVALLMLPGLAGTAIYQVNIAVGRFLALFLNNAGVTEMYLANRTMEIPIGVFAIAVTTVVYPLIARHAAAGNGRALAADYLKGIRMILLINLPAAVGLILLSHPIVQLLYHHGKVTEQGVHDIARLLVIFALGLPFFSVVNLTIRAFFAVKDMKTPVRIAAIDFVVNVAVSLSLMRWLGVAGLVIGSTTAIVVQTLLFRRALGRRFPEVKLASLGPVMAKIAGATLAMGLAVRGGWVLISRAGLRQETAAAAAVFALIPAGIAVYGAMLFLLRIEGREELIGMLRRRFGRA